MIILLLIILCVGWYLGVPSSPLSLVGAAAATDEAGVSPPLPSASSGAAAAPDEAGISGAPGAPGNQVSATARRTLTQRACVSPG